MRIESTTNQRVKAVRRLHRGRERHRTGRTLLEGPKLVETALDAGVVPVEVYTDAGGELVRRCEAAGAQVIETDRKVLESIATTVEPQDPVAVLEVPEQPGLDSERLVVLVDISDPGNLGTLIRSGAALGWQVALLRRADPWSPKVLRSGAGAHFIAPPVPISNFDEIVDAGYLTVALVVSGGKPPFDIPEGRAVALVVGSESHGLPEHIVSSCDIALSLPMVGAVESMNAAVAGAIAMFAMG